MQYTSYASWQRRVVAHAIDQVLLAPFLITLAFPERFRLAVIWTMVAFWFTSTLIIQGRSGRSVGRRLTNTRLVDRWTGDPIGFWRAAVRGAVHILDIVPLFLGYLWPLWDARRQTWADKIMSTVVVDERAPSATPSVIALPRQDDKAPALEPVA